MTKDERYRHIMASLNNMSTLEIPKPSLDGTIAGEACFVEAHSVVSIGVMPVLLVKYQGPSATGEGLVDAVQQGAVGHLFDAHTDMRAFLHAARVCASGTVGRSIRSLQLLWQPDEQSERLITSFVAEIWTLDVPTNMYSEPHLFVLEDGHEVRQREAITRHPCQAARVTKVYPIDPWKLQ